MRIFITSRLHLLLLLGCVAFSVYSCNSGNGIKIGMILPNLVEDRFPKDRDYFCAKVKELGGEVIVVDGQYNDQLQITQAEDLISQGVKVLVVICINKTTAAAIIRYAHAKNVKVIAYERIISNCDLDYFVSFDNVKVGELMAGYMVQRKPEGKYVLLGGDKGDQNAIWVKQGQLNVLQPYVKSGKIKIVYNSFLESWAREEAEHELKTYLNLANDGIPDVILSSADGISFGVISAFKEFNLMGKILLTGQDAAVDMCRYIVRYGNSMTVYKPIKQEAEQAAILAMKCAKREAVSVTQTINNGYVEVPAILIQPISVDKENMKNTVIADHFVTEASIYGD